MSTLSLLLQLLFLLVTMVWMAGRSIPIYRLIYTICKWSSLYPEQQLVSLTGYQEVVPYLLGIFLSMGFWGVLGLPILMYGCTGTIVLDYLTRLTVLLYWRYRHTHQLTI